MRAPPPPLRFLAAVVGGWTLARGTVLMWPEAVPQPPRAEAGHAALAGRAAPVSQGAPTRPSEVQANPVPRSGPVNQPRAPAVAGPALYLLPEQAPQGVASPVLATVQAPPPSAGAGLVTGDLPPWPMAMSPAPAPSRWSLSAWAFAREGGGSALAPGGMLGGSQAGARVRYRVSPALSFSARLSSPRRMAGAEAAVGIEWRPSARLPLRFLAERRQKLGPEGRSAFALTAYGGVSDAPLGRFRLDAYGQAGVVGANSRDLFADGAARLSLPLGDRVKIGAGAWGAAQPSAARLDLGPSASMRLPTGDANVSVSLDWRLRVAGDARPGSGPALTVTTEF